MKRDEIRLLKRGQTVRSVVGSTLYLVLGLITDEARGLGLRVLEEELVITDENLERYFCTRGGSKLAIRQASDLRLGDVLIRTDGTGRTRVVADFIDDRATVVRIREFYGGQLESLILAD